MPKVVPEYKEEARNRIIAESTQLFLEQGYKKTKMTDIARKLGVSKGAIYQYFNSKEELLIEAIKNSENFRKSSLFYELTPQEIETIKTPEFFNRLIQTSDKINKLAMELATEALYNQSMMKEITKFYVEEIDLVAGYFEKLKEAGTVRPDTDTKAVAIGILALRAGLRGFKTTSLEQGAIDRSWTLYISLLLEDIAAGNRKNS